MIILELKETRDVNVSGGDEMVYASVPVASSPGLQMAGFFHLSSVLEQIIKSDSLNFFHIFNE